MGADDASPADMQPRFPANGAGSLSLDEDIVERLLAGDLPPHHAPPGCAKVAALLAATVAPPRPEELAGQAAALAEFRAVTHARTIPARARRTGRRSRRRLALAVVAVAATLATGGAAVAAGGHFPGPVRDVAHSILVSVGGELSAPPAVRGPGPGATTAVPSGPERTGQAGPAAQGSPATGSAAVPGTTALDTKGLCRAYLASQGKQAGEQLEAAFLDLLADEADGADKVLPYCRHLLADDAEPKQGKQKPPPDDQGQGQGHSGPPPTTGGGQGQTMPPNTRASR